MLQVNVRSWNFMVNQRKECSGKNWPITATTTTTTKVDIWKRWANRLMSCGNSQTTSNCSSASFEYANDLTPSTVHQHANCWLWFWFTAIHKIIWIENMFFHFFVCCALDACNSRCVFGCKRTGLVNFSVKTQCASVVKWARLISHHQQQQSHLNKSIFEPGIKTANNENNVHESHVLDTIERMRMVDKPNWTH